MVCLINRVIAAGIMWTSVEFKWYSNTYKDWQLQLQLLHFRIHFIKICETLIATIITLIIHCCINRQSSQ